MKALLGFMVFSSALLFGVLGYQLWHNAMERYKFVVDHFIFYLVLYNISVVGTLSIYFSNSYGIPLIVTQAFLILSATLVAWQFAHFDAWTAWVLLVMLSLYDLCAVLTPCGPLKALVNLMQRDDAPELPGLLYEAELPSNVGRRNRRRNDQNNNTPANPNETQSDNNNGVQTTETNNNQNDHPIVSEQVRQMNTVSTTNHVNDDNCESAISNHNDEETTDVVHTSKISSIPIYHDDDAENTNEPMSPMNTYIPASLLPNNPANSMDQPPQVQIQTTLKGTVPLALAQIYRLRILEPSPFANIEPFSQHANNNSNPSETKQSVNDLLASKFTSDELKTDVIVEFPSHGGVIEQDIDHPLNQQSPRYLVKDRHGGIKRVLLLDPNGRVMEEVHNDSLTPQQINSNRPAESSSSTNESIKLGLVR